MSNFPIILRWRLAPGLSLAPKAETELALTLADGRIVTLKPSTIGLRDALLAMVEGADEARLLALAGGNGGAMLHHYIAKLVAGGIVEVSADDGAVPLIRLIPLQIEFSLPRAEAPAAARDAQPLRLSQAERARGNITTSRCPFRGVDRG